MKKEMFIKNRDNKEISVIFFSSPISNAPLLIDVHGGGFISGHHFDDEKLCAEIYGKTHFNVATIDYRYAPEVTYPKATEDCYDIFTALLNNHTIDFSRDKVFLMGHSAGANVVAGISILCRDNNKIAGQILNYPFLDGNIKSQRRPHIKYSMSAMQTRYFVNKYMPEKDRRKESLASPINMENITAKKIPPTLINVCGFDSLRIDGLKYYELLKRNEIAVELKNYANALHGFIEIVSNGSIDKKKWINPKLINTQKQLYSDAVNDICDYLIKHAKSCY